jgi:L-ornithine N5-monooxygenase
MQIYDLIGIGFGPSNIALAIALDERREGDKLAQSMFIEKQPGFVWHKNMLLDNTRMQISFLKDLATLRNPLSPFTFLNYLHEKRRLQDFINLKTFFPTRQEFNDYLSWAAAQFEDRCAYGEEVFEVLPEVRADQIALLRIRSRDSDGYVYERLTRNLVVSIGGAPNIPECFQPFKSDPRVFHSSNYLREIARFPDARRFAIVGAGQSAAEIFMNLHGRSDKPQVDLVMRARALKPSDDSPFVNEIFNADFTDFMFSRPHSERSELLDEFWHTNYAAPDLELVQQIFGVFYDQRVGKVARHRFLRRHDVTSARSTDNGVELTLRDLDHDQASVKNYDIVILATGYGRDRHKSLLEPLAPYFYDFEIDRDYRLRSVKEFLPAIFLQGACETTHGLSDTLLSVIAIRSGEIGRAILATSEQLHSHMELSPREEASAV